MVGKISHNTRECIDIRKLRQLIFITAQIKLNILKIR